MKPRFLIYSHYAKYGSRDEITGYRKFLETTAETKAWADYKAEKLGEYCDFISIEDTQPEQKISIPEDLFDDRSDIPF